VRTRLEACFGLALLLAGCGGAPHTTLSGNSISFPATSIGVVRYASGVKLTNFGGSALTGIRVAVSGADAAQFAASDTCVGSLGTGGSCIISAAFTPTAAGSYSATLTISDNAANSPQTISLSGTGTAERITRALYSFPEPDASITPLYALVNGAQKTIDMTMYYLVDPIFSADLVAACNRRVTVRVILDTREEGSNNAAAFTQLNSVANCSAVWANKAFAATHNKSFIVDGSQVAIMSINLHTLWYSHWRDFVLLENDPLDIAAIQPTFNADYAAGTTAAGVSGASDYKYVPGAGDNDLIWSPTTADTDMVGLITNAKSTLLVENEYMSAPDIVSALEAACQRGVQVHIAMTDFSSFSTEFAALKAAGCGVYLYPDSGGFYVHTKAVVADYGLSTQNAYMGSINYYTQSLSHNRELGIYLSDPEAVKLLNDTMAADYAGKGVIY